MENVYLKRAKELIQTTEAVFAYVSKDGGIVSDMKGIGFVASLCDEKRDLSEGAVADKIVGKAAALLFVLLGAKVVYAQTLSEGGALVFEKYGVSYSYKEKVKAIINRRGDGLCPMENAVKEIDEPSLALEAVRAILEALRKQG